MDDWQTQMKINNLENKVNSLSSSQSYYSGPPAEGAELRKQVMWVVILFVMPIVVGVVSNWDYAFYYVIGLTILHVVVGFFRWLGVS